MYEIALLGAGRIGRIHAANAVADDRLNLKYICDPATTAAEDLAARYGARTADVDTVFADPDIAGVIVASSTDTHLDYAIRGVEAGKGVFCEKPIDLDLARAEGAAGVLGASGARLFLGFNRRFDPNFRALKDRIADGAMGVLETLHIISHDPAPPPVDYIRSSGGMFKDMSIHDFDMARWLLGEEPVDVFAATACLVDPAIGEAGDVDTAKTVLRTATGKLCVISNSRRSGYGYDQRIEAFCSGGMLHVGNVTETTVGQWREGGAACDRFQNFFLDRYAEAYRREMTHFADILAGTQMPLCGYSDGVAALKLATAADQSARSAAPVAV